MFRKVPSNRVHRLFYPQVPAVVSASHDDEVGALLATSIIPVSLEPSMVGVALGKQHRTRRLVEASGCFSACWLSYEKLERFQLLAEHSEARDKLRQVGLSYRWGEYVRAPVLEDAVAWLECRLEWSREVGDHFFYAARVETAYAVEDFDEYWRFMQYKPILYIGSAKQELPRFLKLSVE
ncbi:MAG: flavin reductase family protein [Candidatus Caldarchaeum sp.]